MAPTTSHLATAYAALERALLDARAIDESNAQVLDVLAQIEKLSRQVDALKARYAGQVSVRSRVALGDAGLAAQQGYLTPAALVRDITRSNYRDAARRVRFGTVFAEWDAAHHGRAASESTREPHPLDPITCAVATAELSADAAEQVIRTLSPIIPEVDGDELTRAATRLAHAGTACDSDELAAMAREVRDRLHRRGVADREAGLRKQRALRRGRVVDGLRTMTLVLDPESGAILVGAIDAAMSPRLGGPRFVDSTVHQATHRLMADDRTNEQLALDALVELVRLGADHDVFELPAVGAPVRVTIPVSDLAAAADEHDSAAQNNSTAQHDAEAHGVGWLEGHPEPISSATARRYLCDRGALPIVLGGDGAPLDVGRARRLFTPAQRVALATRDGGCRWPACDRPPSWTEAHHIRPFSQGGPTNLSNGILLCRRHHLLLHNHGWQIQRDPLDFWLIPPTTQGAAASRVRMPSKVPWAKPQFLADVAGTA